MTEKNSPLEDAVGIVLGRLNDRSLAELDDYAQRPPCTLNDCYEYGCGGYGNCDR